MGPTVEKPKQGRPVKYATEAERIAALRSSKAKSARKYYDSNWETVNERRRIMYENSREEVLDEKRKKSVRPVGRPRKREPATAEVAESNENLDTK